MPQTEMLPQRFCLQTSFARAEANARILSTVPGILAVALRRQDRRIHVRVGLCQPTFRKQAQGVARNRTQLFATSVDKDNVSVAASLNLSTAAAAPTQDAVFKFTGLGAGITAAAYVFYPQLLDFASKLQQEFALGELTGQDAWFFSFVSLVFSLLAGATFEFQYGRQQLIMQALYDEIFALETLWRQAQIKAPDVVDEVAANLRTYICEEIYMTDKNRSPFYEESPILALSQIFTNRNRGSNSGLSDMLQTLIQAQNQREAATVRILPTMHWVVLWSLVLAVLLSTLAFETAATGDAIIAQRVAFSVFSGLASSIVLINQDLSKPIEGSYSIFGRIKQRLEYLVEDLRRTKKP